MKRRIGAFLLALSLALWLLPAAALASEEQPAEGEVLYTLSDNTKVIKGNTTIKVTRAQLAELIYANKLLQNNIFLAGEGNESMTLPFTDLKVEGEGANCTETQKTAITALYKAGYISGTSATKFSPNAEVSRGDGMLVIWMADGSRSNKEPMENPFADESIKPHHLPVATCFYAAGMISGQEGTDGEGPTFGGDEALSLFEAYMFIQRFDSKNETYQAFQNNTVSGSVTRAEMTEEFYNRFQQELSKIDPTGDDTMPFTDLAGCTEDQKDAIQFFYERGIISGTGDTTFTPYGPVSNLQLATLLQRCATAAEAPAEEETQAVSLLRAAPLSLEAEPGETDSGAGNTLDAAFQFLLDNSAKDASITASVQAADNNQNAPGLTQDLEAWSDALTPNKPTITISGSTVTIEGDTGATIYYTTGETAPNSTRGTKYEGQFTLTASATVKAVAVKNNLVSSVAQATYTAPVLTITPSAASLSGGGTVTLTVANLPAGVTAENVSVTCATEGIVPARNDDGTWTVTLPNATASYTFTASADGYTDATITVQVTAQSSGNTGGSSGGSSGRPSTTTETVTNPDGSTTTTTTNKATGTVTETTRYPDGAREVVETKKDGTVTTTSTDADGSETAVVENPDGSREMRAELADGTSVSAVTGADGRVQAEVSLSSRAVSAAQEEGSAVTLPMPEVPVTADREAAPTVTVDLPDGTAARVEIPVAEVTPGTVAVLVRADGSEEVIRTSLTTETGVTVALSDGDTVKLVDNTKTFSDVPAGHWAAEEVAFAASRELFQGTGGGTFAPEAAMSRAMILTVLARLEGVDTSAGDTWYSAGLQWAVEAGISDGSAPEQGLTREQLALMLYRYAGQPAAESGLGGFADGSSVSDWAAQGMAWAVEEGLISGVGGNTLSPQGAATRAQVAAILARFFQLL